MKVGAFQIQSNNNHALMAPASFLWKWFIPEMNLREFRLETAARKQPRLDASASNKYSCKHRRAMLRYILVIDSRAQNAVAAPPDSHPSVSLVRDKWHSPHLNHLKNFTFTRLRLIYVLEHLQRRSCSTSTLCFDFRRVACRHLLEHFNSWCT